MRYLILYILKTLLLACSHWLFGCTDLSEYDRSSVKDALSDSLLSVTESRNIQMNLIEDGRRMVTVASPFAATFDGNGLTKTELRDSVHVTVLDSTGTEETTVVSQSARYLAYDSDFHFIKDVVVETRDGRTLFTDYLEWSQQDRTIYSPGFVIIVTATDSITGYGLEGSDDLVFYRLSEVTGEFELEKSRE